MANKVATVLHGKQNQVLLTQVTERQTERRTDSRADKQTKGRTDRLRDEQTVGQIDRHSDSLSIASSAETVEETHNSQLWETRTSTMYLGLVACLRDRCIRSKDCIVGL